MSILASLNVLTTLADLRRKQAGSLPPNIWINLNSVPSILTIILFNIE